jgi:hypothetical protein
MAEEKLFEKRIGAYFQSSIIGRLPLNIKGDIYASWPMSKLIMYKDRMLIKILWQGEFIIKYSDIINLEKVLFGIQIHHKNKNLKPVVYLGGAGNGSILFKKIKEVIIKNKLEINVKD